MKYLVLIVFYSSLLFSADDQFIKEASTLATDLRQALMHNLSQKMTMEGSEAAVPFCQSQIKLIAKQAAKERSQKYEFGRTSHKVRNRINSPQPWAMQYLKEFEGKKKSEVTKDHLVHRLADGKRVYLEPLYVEAKCLTCHGQNIAQNVSRKINDLYPDDKATGFSLGEFRGFIWVKEK